jgi:hypothetical protein
MSLFINVQATCAACGAHRVVELAASVNATRRPDLRDAILDGSFQSVTCAGCDAALRLPAHLSYLDVGRGQWIIVQGAEELPQWRTAEDNARALFEDTYGANASTAARELGAELRPRLVFGWPALREKLVCDEAGLEDITLELLKIAIIRDVREPPFGDATELRLTGGDEAALQFAWVEGATETQLATLSVGRELYDTIAASPDSWAALRGDLVGKLFVDLKRLVFA